MKGAQRAGRADRGVGRLDEQPAGMRVSGARDVTVPGRLLAGLTDARIATVCRANMPVRNIRLGRHSMSSGLFCSRVFTVWRALTFAAGRDLGHDRPIRRTRRDDADDARGGRRAALQPQQPRLRVLLDLGDRCPHGRARWSVGAGDEDRLAAVGEQRRDDRDDLLGRLALGQHRLGHALALGPTRVEPSEPEIDESRPGQALLGVLRRERPARDERDDLA
jgi:hypothetical protein